MQATNPQVREIWDLIKETRKDIKEYRKGLKELRESQKEAGQRLTKLFTETRESIKELSAETNEQMKKTDIKLNKYIGNVGNYWGKLGENLIKGNLAQRLKERGIEVEKVVTNAKFSGVKFVILLLSTGH